MHAAQRRSLRPLRLAPANARRDVCVADDAGAHLRLHSQYAVCQNPLCGGAHGMVYHARDRVREINAITNPTSTTQIGPN